MRSCVALVAVAFVVAAAGCGGSSPRPLSVGELRQALARQGVTTTVLFDQHRTSPRAYSVGFPILVHDFQWRRFVPAYAVVADRRSSPQIEAYVFDTDSAARSAARSCPSCLAARNVVVAARPDARGEVEAALANLT